MQTRTCFNGGELAPEMAARCDIDVYMRGLQVGENWELGQMGGVKRRRGMRGVTQALGANSRLFAYKYSANWGCFIVEVNARMVRVFLPDGTEQASFTSGQGGCPTFTFDGYVTARQVNALLLLCSRNSWPLELRMNDAGEWTLQRMELTHAPWRYNERRDNALTLTASNVLGVANYAVAFAAEEEATEASVQAGDTLRASIWLETAEASETSSVMWKKARVVTSVEACAVGDMVAIWREKVRQPWVCKKEFSSSTFVTGLDDPGSYPDNFEKPENVAGFEGATVVASVGELGNVSVKTKFYIETGYWEYFTCIKAFPAEAIAEGLGYEDYTGYFVRGIPVGEALPCRGKWEFLCSGIWNGSYEVIRNYRGPELSADWESAGVSFSRLSEPSNDQLAGDEGDEECWLRLMLTRSKHMSSTPEAGFPSDSCGNRLVVEGYRHDVELQWQDGVWSCVNAIKPKLNGLMEVHDWSWCAWSDRYGYPAACEVYSQRLVFASTAAQPQTIWMSRTDDLFNFAGGDTDDSAIDRTLYTTSQNPIGWMVESNGRLMLGTADAEWTISVPSGQAVTPTNLWVTRHGRVGCAEGLCLPVDDKALFVQRGGGRLWAYGYSFEVDGCRSTDLTVFAPHALQAHGGAVSATLLETPDTVAVFALADGQVALCTYNTMHEVHAWHRWVTDGRVLSVAALPDGNRADRLFLLVERADGVWIEVVDEDSPYVDRGGRGYTSTLVTTPLYNPLEQQVQKSPKVPVKVLFGEACETRHLEVCADGGSWKRAAYCAASFSAGWHELLVVNRWEETNAVGIRYTGESCTILALQG